MMSALTETERRALDVLGRLLYATQGQLQQWGIPQYSISRMLPKLEKSGLVRALRDYSPNIIHITHRGAQRVNRSLPSGKSYLSWSAMAHRCRRNRVELELRERFARFTFYSRPYAYARGLNPARGEHGATDEAGRHYLVMLDDYLMRPGRVVQSWTRLHSANRDYYDSPMGRVWADVAEHLIIVTTDAAQLPRYKNLLEKCQAASALLHEGERPSKVQALLGLKNSDSAQDYARIPAMTEVRLSDPIWRIS